MDPALTHDPGLYNPCSRDHLSIYSDIAGKISHLPSFHVPMFPNSSPSAVTKTAFLLCQFFSPLFKIM